MSLLYRRMMMKGNLAMEEWRLLKTITLNDAPDKSNNIVIHSRSAQWALPYEPPTGSHDMYKVGEYMVYNGSVYVCKLDTNYNPDDLAQAWEQED